MDRYYFLFLGLCNAFLHNLLIRLFRLINCDIFGINVRIIKFTYAIG